MLRHRLALKKGGRNVSGVFRRSSTVARVSVKTSIFKGQVIKVTTCTTKLKRLS